MFLYLILKNFDETKRISEEEKDRDNRRNNIIIYHLSESSAAFPDDRRNEDFDMCLTLVRDTLGVDCTAEDIKLECGPMPNLMVALPNIGGALCSTPQSLADAHY